MGSKKKILFIHHGTGWGGASNSLIKLINSLDKSKYSILVLLLKDSSLKKYLEEKNISYIIAKSWFYKKYYSYYSHTITGYTKWYFVFRHIKLITYWLLSKYYFAKKELSQLEYDIIHLNSSVLTDWLFPCSKKGKVIIHIRESIFKGRFGIGHHFFTSEMKKYAERIIAISKDNGRRLEVPEKTMVIYNYTKLSLDKPKPNSYQNKKVLYVGGAALIKGFFTLVEALQYLESDIEVLFIGNYPNKINTSDGLKDSIKSFFPKSKKIMLAMEILQKSKNATLLGLVKDITPFINDTCCLVSPFSKSHFSRPIIEAYANYKPVIATNIIGMDEIVIHKETGILVENNNPKELAKSINYLCNNSILAKKMGEIGFELAKKSFSPTNINDFEKIYDSL